MKHIVVTPTINQRKPMPEEWTEEDTNQFVELICLNGHNYKKIAEKMMGKTPLSLKRKVEQMRDRPKKMNMLEMVEWF